MKTKLNKGKINYLTFDILKDIVHGYTIDNRYSFRTDLENSHGLLKEEEYNESVNNYKTLASLLKINYLNIVKVNQEHTSNIKIIEEKKNKNEMDLNIKEYRNFDGMITNKKNIALTTVSADCLVFLMYDKVNKVIANIHSGWRGTLEEIGAKALKMMHDNFNSNYEDIIICFCPSIGKECFEVEEDVYKLFINKYKNLENINSIIKKKSNNKWLIDTILLNKTIFLNLGIKEENIILSGMCTKCNKNIMHSYRGKTKGLNTAIIML